MNCNLCKRNCNIDRDKDFGFCNANNNLKIAKYTLYYYEEPCISGKNGSGTIFFSNCNLRCVYCQNYEISLEEYGKEISLEEFADICLELQNKGANNINLVTPGHFALKIKEGIILAKKKGLIIPVVYNTNSYESVETIKELEGIIDIYLPDFKYYDDNLATKYSLAPGYCNNAKEVIDEMYKQVGKPKFKNGIMQKGMIVRHLMLPTLTYDSKKIIKYLYDTYKNNIYISIMNQYTPMKHFDDDILNKTISKEEYNDIIDCAYDLGIRNCFVQEDETAKKSFIPNFKE